MLSCCTLSFPIAFCLVLSCPVLHCNQYYYQDNSYHTWIEWNDVLWYDMARSRTLYCDCTTSHPDLFCPAFARSAKLNVNSSICAADQVMSGVDTISLSIYLSICLSLSFFLSLPHSLSLCLSLSLSLCLSICLSLSFSLSLSPSLSLCLSLSLSLSISPSPSFPAASLSHTIPLLEVTKWI